MLNTYQIFYQPIAVIFDSKTARLSGRMKAYSLFVCVNFCSIYKYTSIKIKPELKKNIVKFGYGINYKYEGMLAHSFHRFYVVTNSILPSASDRNLSKFSFKDNCEYLRKRGKGVNHRIEKHILDLIDYCRKIKPYVHLYKKQIESLTILHIIY